MEVLVVNGDRYLISSDSSEVDNICEGIISKYPFDAVVDFDEVTFADLQSNKYPK